MIEMAGVALMRSEDLSKSGPDFAKALSDSQRPKARAYFANYLEDPVLAFFLSEVFLSEVFSSEELDDSLELSRSDPEPLRA